MNKDLPDPWDHLDRKAHADPEAFKAKTARLVRFRITNGAEPQSGFRSLMATGASMWTCAGLSDHMANRGLVAPVHLGLPVHLVLVAAAIPIFQAAGNFSKG